MSRRRIIVTVLLAVLASLVLSIAWDEALDTDSSAEVVRSEPVAATVPIVLTDPKIWARTMRERFAADQINDSKNRILPVPLYRHLWRYAEDATVDGAIRLARAQRIGRWLGTPLGKRHVKAAACAVPDVDLLSPCLRRWTTGDGPTPLEEEIVKVKVICGGAGIVGALKGGGVAGFGLGSGACVFTEFANQLF